ncbi:hypothetical protein GCK32_009083, partial [Trichostrongylus colubriformis]
RSCYQSVISITVPVTRTDRRPAIDEMSVVEKETLLVREHGISDTYSSFSSSATYNLINFLNGMIGPGCFSVAMAFKQGGLWMSFFLVFFLGAISTISMLKIVKCSQHLSRLYGNTCLDYGDMAESAFGHSAYPILVRHKSKAKFLKFNPNWNFLIPGALCS